MHRIAIVGGGPGGWFAAHLLEQKSRGRLDITLLEAADRVGGKVLTRQFDAAPVIYEAGTAELYRYLYAPDPLWKLVESLGLKTVNMAGAAVVMDHHVLRGPADIRHHFGDKTARAVEKFDAFARKARTPKDFTHAGGTGDNQHPLARRTFESLLSGVGDADAERYLRFAVHSDLGTEPQQTSGLYGLDNFLLDRTDYCQLYSIEGGIERLPRAIERGLSAVIKKNAPVREVAAARDGKYRVVHGQGSSLLAEEFDGVMVALPVYWLPMINWVGKRLAGAAARHHAYYHRPAHYLRITILFRRPFWRDQISDTYFQLDAFGGCCIYDEGTRYDAGSYGVLSWLVGGDHALVMNNLSDAVLVEQALASLPPQMEAEKELVVEAQVQRWLGTVNAQPGGVPIRGRKRRHFLAPKAYPGLLVIGDYLFDSTINGAMESAEVATDLMLGYLDVSSGGV